ncbi:MAG: AI-2E family transporter [Eubacterium sp.]|jgi:predicted PurR-regulated permease PerM|nr:AI-2E family transporter [Eubacterium sp.]
MKYKWDKKYLYWGTTAFLVATAFVLFSSLVTNIKSVSSFFFGIGEALAPVIFGFVFAYILTPVMNFFEKRVFRLLFSFIYKKADQKKLMGNPSAGFRDRTLEICRLSRGFGVFATMLSAVVLVAALIWAVIPQLVVSFQNILRLDYITNMRDTMSGWAGNLFSGYPELYNEILSYINNFVNLLNSFISDFEMTQWLDMLANVSTGIFRTLKTVFNFIVGIIICVYLLNGKDLLAAQGKKALYSMFNVKNANIIIENIRHIHKKFGGFLIGKIIDSLIIGIIFFVILNIIGTPYAILVSVILGVTNVIPVFGPFIGAIPCGLLVLFESPPHCFWFVIIVIIVQQFDGNVLGPKILGDNTGLSSFWVIFALLLGQHFFGFAGLIIGIPIFAVLYSLFKNYVVKRLKYKELPVNTNYYRELGYFNTESGEAVSLKSLKEKDATARARIEAEKRKNRKKSVVGKKISELRSKNNNKSD